MAMGLYFLLSFHYDGSGSMPDREPHMESLTKNIPAKKLPFSAPGAVPTANITSDLTIRAYKSEDDPYLMELERLCPRGEPRPFVHFRRRFADRAMLYSEPYLFIAEKDGRPVGVTSIAIKETTLGDEPVRIAYSFDTRVHPGYRRQGIANAMQEEKLAFLKSEGVHGLYAYVVSTNFASVSMLEKVGFQKARMILLLTYHPYPLIIPPPEAPVEIDMMQCQSIVEKTFGVRDLFIEEVSRRVHSFNSRRYVLTTPDTQVGLSIFDQSLVYQQVSADDPWPTEAEVSKRARTLRIFHEAGIKSGEVLRIVFDHVRDIAVVSNVSKITWLIDRNDPLPGFVFQEAHAQKDYWMLVNWLEPDWEPQWKSGPIYMDTRDL